MPVPPVRELEAICGGEGRDPADPRDFRSAYARPVRKLSIRFTWLLLHTRLSANQVTVLAIAVGVAGAMLLAWSDFWPLLVGVLLLQLSFVLDFSDGEIARTRPAPGGPPQRGRSVPRLDRALLRSRHDDRGARLRRVHRQRARLASAGCARGRLQPRSDRLLRPRPRAARALPRRSGAPWLTGFLRAVLARQGGDPDLLDLDADYRERRAGSQGRGLLWRRQTNLGQVLVFPGLVNLVTLAVVIDCVASGLGGDYPGADETIARTLLIAGLGIVHVLHQLRAAAQGFQVLRRLG